jgi:hypothetical protein
MRFDGYMPGLLIGAWLCAPGLAGGADTERGSSLKDRPTTRTAKTQPAAARTTAASMPTGAPKLYRFKGEKKGGLGDGQAMVLMLEDIFTGKSESLFVPNNDPASAKVDPLTSVAAAVKELTPGTLVDVRTERQKGRPMVVSLAKANLVPGEERPNMYVLVAWDKKKQADGKPIMAVKLKKFGREITLPVPLTKNAQTNDWAAPWGVEHALGKVQPGEVLEAKIKPGNPPVLQDLYLYRPPERGKFLEFTQVENGNDVTAAAFKLLQADGITVTVTLPGVEQMKGTTKVLMPDPKQLRAVQQIKPGSEIEMTLQPGDQYILREIKVLSPPASTSAAR